MSNHDSEAGGNPGFKLIPLHGKYGEGKFAKVSTEDFEYLNQFRWHCTKTGYAKRSNRVDGYSHYRPMHNEVLGRMGLRVSRTEGTLPDHKDLDRLNNMRENLRVATHSQNTSNQAPQQKTSRFKGVRLFGAAIKAQIHYKMKTWYLGSYLDEETAAKAYDKAARYFYGEFAYTNFPGSEIEGPESIAQTAMQAYKDRKASPYQGVRRKDKKWLAVLIVDGKANRRNCVTQEEAARAYDDMRAEHGLPRINFPDEQSAPLNRGANVWPRAPRAFLRS